MSKLYKILVFGGVGQLGQCLNKISNERNYSNERGTSWYDVGKTIFDISEITVKLSPIPASTYPTKAIRPAFSVMDKGKIKRKFKLEIPYWRDSLIKCIRELNKIE